MDNTNVPDDQKHGLQLKCPYCGWKIRKWATEDQFGQPMIETCPQCKERFEGVLEKSS